MPTQSTGASGVPASNKLPAMFLEVVFGASPNSSAGNPRYVLLIGQKTSAGSATADTDLNLLTSSTDAIAYFGEGSELALMADAAFTAAPGATVWGIAPATGGGVAASGTVTAATTCTATGTYSLWIHGVLVQIGVNKGDTVTTIGANLAAAINSKGRYLNVTATASSGVVTITCRHVGTRGNLITLRQLVGSDVGGTTFALSAAALASGTLVDTMTNVLAVVAAKTFKYYAPASVDTTALQAIQTQLTTMAGPLVGKRQQGIYASVDTLATLTTQAQTLNESLMEALWHPNAEDLPGVVAAGWAAYRSVAESQMLLSVPLVNIDISGWVKPQPLVKNYVTTTQASSALDVGITPLMVSENGRVVVPRAITTHSKDSSGNPDVRTLDTVNVTVAHGFADEVSTQVPTQFPSMRLADDELPGDDPLPAGVVTPSTIKSFVFGIAKSWQSVLGHLTNIDTDYASWAFNLAPSSPGRVNATMGIHPVKWFVQFSGQVRQLT